MNLDVHRINYYIVQIYYDVNIETNRQNSIDKVLKRRRNVDEIEKKYVILEMIISSTKNCFSFVFMLDTQSMINNNQINVDIFDDFVESI